MTTQETIDELQYAIDLIKQNGKDWIDERDIPILETAIHALEKQIPKKPNNCIWYGDGSAMGHCPVCDTLMDSNSDAHCYGCGQAIDWEDEGMTLEEAIKHCEETAE